MARHSPSDLALAALAGAVATMAAIALAARLRPAQPPEDDCDCPECAGPGGIDMDDEVMRFLAGHGRAFCSCGVELGHCACDACLATGPRRQETFPDACAVCVQRGISRKMGPVLEVGAASIEASLDGHLLGLRGISVAVPLANLRSALAIATARGLADEDQVGLLLTHATALEPGRPVELGASPDGRHGPRTGDCIVCGKRRLLEGPYCVPCALAAREGG